jgi:hypothetical protein
MHLAVLEGWVVDAGHEAREGKGPCDGRRHYEQQRKSSNERRIIYTITHIIDIHSLYGEGGRFSRGHQ